MICLTIAVPAYNAAATLEKCLNSFLEEKFRGRLEGRRGELTVPQTIPNPLPGPIRRGGLRCSA